MTHGQWISDSEIQSKMHYLVGCIIRTNLKTGKGLNRGDRIGMYAVNHYEWIVTQLAAAKAGLILGKDDHNHKKLFSKAIKFTFLYLSIDLAVTLPLWV